MDIAAIQCLIVAARSVAAWLFTDMANEVIPIAVWALVTFGVDGGLVRQADGEIAAFFKPFVVGRCVDAFLDFGSVQHPFWFFIHVRN